MADRISWIKNLLGHGTTAEQNAVKRVGDYANRTGNETFILGSKINPAVTTPLSTTGTPNNAGYPEGYNDLLLSLRSDPLFTAHPHPRGTSVGASAADLGVWSNLYHPGSSATPDLSKRLINDADAARAGMWITSPKLGDNAQLYLPPFVHSGSGEDDILKALKLVNRQGEAQDWGGAEKAIRLNDHVREFNKAWGIPSLANVNPDLQATYNSSLHYVQPVNDLAKDIPVHIDPHTSIYPGSPFRIGEVWPEWMKYAEDKGYNPYSDTGRAEGGQIPAYGEGGYDDPSQGYSIPPGSFGPSSSPTPTFQMPIGKGQATVGGNYDLINKIIEAQLGYEHPVGSHGARLGVSGNFNKYIGEGGDQAKPNWGVGLRLNLPFAEGGSVPGYELGGVPAVVPGANAIRWIKNLLGQGTEAEQAMVADARRHAAMTGNEKFLVGETGGPQIRPAPLTKLGDKTSVGFPQGYGKFMVQAGQESIPVSSAHPHPEGMAIPSIGDLNVWANYRNYPGRTSSATLYPADKIARQNMWIAGMKGENDVGMLPSMEHVSPTDDYAKIHDLQNTQRRFFNVLRDDQSMYDLRKKADDFTKDWYLLPHQQWDAFHSLNRAPLANRIAQQTPFHMDPAMQLVKGRTDLPAGEIYPEWLKAIQGTDVDMFKAEGGQIDGYAGGGQKVVDAIRKVLSWRNVSVPEAKAEVMTAINPSYNDMLRQIKDVGKASNDPYPGLRLARDPQGNVYSWDAGAATHQGMGEALGFPVEPDVFPHIQRSSKGLEDRFGRYPFNPETMPEWFRQGKAEGGQYDPYDDIAEAQRLMGAYK